MGGNAYGTLFLKNERTLRKEKKKKKKKGEKGKNALWWMW